MSCGKSTPSNGSSPVSLERIPSFAMGRPGVKPSSPRVTTCTPRLSMRSSRGADDASARTAATRYTSAVGPLEMNVLAPSRIRPRSVLVTVVWIPAESEPAPGSVNAIAGRMLPLRSGASMAAGVRPPLSRTSAEGARTEAMTPIAKPPATRAISSATMHSMSVVPPAPPSSGGTAIDSRPSSAICGRTRSRGNRPLVSASATRGASSCVAKSRTVFWSRASSSESS